MKIATRRNVFETNSSSVHAIAVLTRDDLARWKAGEYLDLSEGSLSGDAWEEYGEGKEHPISFASQEDRDARVWKKNPYTDEAPGEQGEPFASLATGMISYQTARDLAHFGDDGCEYDRLSVYEAHLEEDGSSGAKFEAEWKVR